MNAVPCKICGCVDGEPGLCHAVVPSGKACWRVQPDWCSACGTWDKILRVNFPDMPVEAMAAHHRSRRAEEAAAKRGTSVPGAYALRVHAVKMVRKANQFCVDAGLLKPTEEKPAAEREKPFCPQSF